MFVRYDVERGGKVIASFVSKASALRYADRNDVDRVVARQTNQPVVRSPQQALEDAVFDTFTKGE